MTQVRPSRPVWRGYTKLLNGQKVKDCTIEELDNHVNENEYSNPKNSIKLIYSWLREAEQNVEWLEEEVNITTKAHLEEHLATEAKLSKALDFLSKIINHQGQLSDHAARKLASEAVNALFGEELSQEEVPEDHPFKDSVF